MTNCNVINTVHPNTTVDIEKDQGLHFVDLKVGDYKKNPVSITAGAGLTIFSFFKDRLRGNFGFRLYYSMGDAMKDATQLPVCDSIYNINKSFNSKYSNPLPTHIISIQALFEIDYFFGYFGKANCGKRRFKLFKL
jgi:hypothetical protein